MASPWCDTSPCPQEAQTLVKVGTLLLYVLITLVLSSFNEPPPGPAKNVPGVPGYYEFEVVPI